MTYPNYPEWWDSHLALVRVPDVLQYHPPDDLKAIGHQQMRNAAAVFWNKLDEAVPESCEKSIARNKIREALMWANAAIALNGVNP